MSFLASNPAFDKIPFAVTAVANLIDLVEKIDLPIEEPPANKKIVEKIAEAVVVPAPKKKLANVVTTLIGYDLDIKA